MANVSSDTKRTTRFGSIVPLSTYRPSYSGGTYKSSGIRKDLKSTSNWTPLSKEISSTAKHTTAANSTSIDVDSKLSSNIYYSTPGNALNKSKAKERGIPTSTTSCRPTLTIAKIQTISNNTYSTSNQAKTIKSIYSPTTSFADKSNSKLNIACKSNNSTDSISYKEENRTDSASKLSPPKVSPKPQLQCVEHAATNYARNEPCDKMIEVTVCNRGTSPNLCSTVPTFTRCRRVEIAKTIEKTILRPINKVHTEDKGIQSDRMDDTSKYCRFSSLRSTQPWLTRLEQKYDSGCYTRYRSPSQSDASALDSYSSNAKNEKSSSESTTGRSTERVSAMKYKEPPSKIRDSSSSKSPSVSRSSSSLRSKSKSIDKLSGEKSSSRSSSDTSQRTPSISPSKQRVFNNKTLPPPAPKSESPTKTVRTSSTSSINGATSSEPSTTKWQNKDFRKSALNVGPSDRCRKHSDGSTKGSSKQLSPHKSIPSSGRSSSVSSETSVSSANDTGDDVVLKNLMNLKISSTSSMPSHASSKLFASKCITDNNARMNVDCESMPSLMTKTSPQQNTEQSVVDNGCSINKLTYALDTMTARHFTGIKSDAADNNSLHGNNRSHENDSNDYTTKYTTNETNSSNGKSSSMEDSFLFNPYGSRPVAGAEDASSETSACTNPTNAIRMNSNKSDPSISGAYDGDNKTLADSSSFPWWMSFEDEKTISSKNSQGKYRITHIQSGERAWWMDADTEETVNEIYEAADAANQTASQQHEYDESQFSANENSDENTFCNIDSEMKSEIIDDDPDIDFWATINESLKEQSSKKQKHTTRVPLEQRESPEGLENSVDRKTESNLLAYDRDAIFDVEPIFKKLFISRHQNIDDVLGGPCQAFGETVDANNNMTSSAPLKNDDNGNVNGNHMETIR